MRSIPSSPFIHAFVTLDCSACTVKLSASPANSRFVPKYSAPERPRETHPTRKFEIGGFANFAASGRSIVIKRGTSTPCSRARAAASLAGITPVKVMAKWLGGLGLWFGRAGGI